MTVATVAQVPAGTVATVQAGGRDLALINYNGSFFALDNDCPHASGPLGQGLLGDGCLLACPWHGAVFDARSGQVLRGPARKAVRTYPVMLEGGAVLVALD
ncbi:MAG: non-heme iron oxygenase ferredoxin subunit [Actinomycetota bacterium]|nr:non-heme iron oxygenase ferredoxin subunit [Actinomycetota bacterium]